MKTTLLDVLDRMRSDIQGCYFALCFDTDSGLTLGMSSVPDFKDDGASIGAAFGQVLDIVARGQKHGRNDTIREALHRFRELILETDVSTFVIMAPEATEARIAVAVGMPKEVKLGYARVAIQRQRHDLVQAVATL